MRRKIVVSIVLGLCALLGLFAVRIDAHGKQQPQVSQASNWTPANGYRADGKCYEVIGQGGFSEQVSCSSWHPVPKQVRQCAAAVFIAGISAFFTHVPVLPAAGTTGGGCLAGLF